MGGFMRQKWTKRIIVPALVLFIALFAGATLAGAEVTPPTDFAAATAPASLKSVGKSTVTLTWNYSGEEQPKHFKIQSADFGVGVKTYTVPGGYRAYTLLNLKSGGTYHYRVRAITASGKSAWSKIIDVVVP
jgi:hypothetical protein